MTGQADDLARERAASVPMPAGLAAQYELAHHAAEEMRAAMRRSGGVARGPVRFPIGPTQDVPEETSA